MLLLLHVRIAWGRRAKAGKSKILSKKGIQGVLNRADWVWSRNKHHQAGQQAWDFPVRVAFAEQMLADMARQFIFLCMSDEKILALSKTHGGGCWHPRNEAPLYVRTCMCQVSMPSFEKFV